MARKAGVSSFQVISRIIEVPYGFARSWLCHAAFETNTLMGAYGILSLAYCHVHFCLEQVNSVVCSRLRVVMTNVFIAYTVRVGSCDVA